MNLFVLFNEADFVGYNLDQGGPSTSLLRATFQNCSSCLRVKAGWKLFKMMLFSKKNSSLGIGLGLSYFRPKIMVFSKKKRVSLESVSDV